MSLAVTLIEPYYGGSHRAWADGYQAASAHHIELLTLPAQFWKWRMQGGAVTLARHFLEQNRNPDVILASDMFDLTIFRALTRSSAVPCALYFHENQLTYPQNSRQRHGWQYGFINYASALAAAAVYFNSAFHLNVFLDELPRMLKHFGDYNELATIDLIRAKSHVLSLGLDLRRFDAHQVQAEPDQPPLILWNHRWEADKNPTLFFDALFQLADEGFAFRVALAGENFKQEPHAFEEARQRLGRRVMHYGYAADFETYARLLWSADYVVSTAYQDFFGIAIVEAMYCGCVPLLPYRLNYPALIPDRFKEACLYSGDDLYGILKRHFQGDIQLEDVSHLQDFIAQFDWQAMAPQYDRELIQLVQAQQSDPGR